MIQEARVSAFKRRIATLQAVAAGQQVGNQCAIGFSRHLRALTMQVELHSEAPTKPPIGVSRRVKIRKALPEEGNKKRSLAIRAPRIGVQDSEVNVIVHLSGSYIECIPALN